MDGQISFIDILYPEVHEPLPCDNCGYDVIGCCDYPDTPEDYCVLGDKWKPKNVTKQKAQILTICRKENEL